MYAVFCSVSARASSRPSRIDGILQGGVAAASRRTHRPSLQIGVGQSIGNLVSWIGYQTLLAEHEQLDTE